MSIELSHLRRNRDDLEGRADKAMAVDLSELRAHIGDSHFNAIAGADKITTVQETLDYIDVLLKEAGDDELSPSEFERYRTRFAGKYSPAAPHRFAQSAVDGAFLVSTAALKALAAKSSEKLSPRQIRDERLAKIRNHDRNLSIVEALAQQKMEQDFTRITQEEVRSRFSHVSVPQNASTSIRVIAASLSSLLGGEVTLKDDSNGGFFNYNDGEQIFLRPRVQYPAFVTEYQTPKEAQRRVTTGDGSAAELLNSAMNYGWHELDRIKDRLGIDQGPHAQRYRDQFGPNSNAYDYTAVGGLRYTISYSILKRLFHTYGKLSDYGIRNVNISFARNKAADIDVDGDTMSIRIGYRVVENKQRGAVLEEFKGPFEYRTTNWWKYREYDPNTVVEKLEGKFGLPSFKWRSDVRSTVVSAGGAVIVGSEAGGNFDPVMVVTPTLDKKVDNYYIQVQSPDPADIERTLLRTKEPIKNDYPGSFILRDALNFSYLQDHLANQLQDIQQREKELLELLPEKDKDGRPIPLAARKATLVARALDNFFTNQEASFGRKALSAIPETMMNSKQRQAVKKITSSKDLFRDGLEF